jgi:hypothetical protein
MFERREERDQLLNERKLWKRALPTAGTHTLPRRRLAYSRLTHPKKKLLLTAGTHTLPRRSCGLQQVAVQEEVSRVQQNSCTYEGSTLAPGTHALTRKGLTLTAGTLHSQEEVAGLQRTHTPRRRLTAGTRQSQEEFTRAAGTHTPRRRAGYSRSSCSRKKRLHACSRTVHSPEVARLQQELATHTKRRTYKILWLSVN